MTPMFELVTSDLPGVFAVDIARPPANAMGFDDVAELHTLLERAAALPDCAALVFRASGRFFSAGADIKLMHAAGTDEASIERWKRAWRRDVAGQRNGRLRYATR